MADHDTLDALIARIEAAAAEMRDWNGRPLLMWDKWSHAIATGDGSSRPRDDYTFMLDGYAKLFIECAAALRARREA